MTPLITIQLMGLVSELRKAREIRRSMREGALEAERAFALLDDDAIIEL